MIDQSINQSIDRSIDRSFNKTNKHKTLKKDPS